MPKNYINSILSGDIYCPNGACRLMNLPWLSGIDAAEPSERLLSFAEYINQFEETSSVIELMLTEARAATTAERASFYRATPNDTLRFAFFQNDSVSSEYHYEDAEIPIDSESIVGYASIACETINIHDVDRIPPEMPFKFIHDLDDAPGEPTVSMLTVPILGSAGKVMGVLQLANAEDDEGCVRAFGEADARYAELLAWQTAPYLLKSIMTRRMVDTMLRMSEARDPKETGAHVRRVGEFAAEIYGEWARNRNIQRDEIMRDKDTLRIAAMLHDIGKVAIPDAVLKKPGRLNEEEYDLMKTHAVRGAEMYAEAETRLEKAAYDITLHHHQRWDGKGYTGSPDHPPLAGEAIPIFARVTSVADVYDALASPRSYKKAWSFESVLDELRRCAGTQFDPEVVDAAIAAAPLLRAIVNKYNPEPEEPGEPEEQKEQKQD